MSVSCHRWAVSPRRHCCACHHCLFVVVMYHILVVSLFHIGAALSSSSRVLSSPRHCHPHVSSSHVLVVSFLCRGLLILCLSHLSRRRPCPSCIVIVPHRRSVVVLWVSKVGWDEHGGGYSPGCLIVTCVHSCMLAIVCVRFRVFFIIWGCAGGRCGS